MKLRFYEVWDELVDSNDGDDSVIGETIFNEYNSMNPKNKLKWEHTTEEPDTNYNSVIRACLTILKQRMSYFDDCYFNYSILDTSEPELQKYIKPIIKVVKRYTIGMVQDILNWTYKANLIADSNINELNMYLSSSTRSSVQPTAKDSDGEPIWTSLTRTNRNADVFLVPDGKWNEFKSFSNVYHELSTIVYNIFRR